MFFNKTRLYLDLEKGSMHLKKLSLYNFKNFEEKQFDFDQKINCFVGNNGVGKTNVLDAIFFLAFGKSYFNNNIRQIVRFEQSGFSIKGIFSIAEKQEEILVSYQTDKKKIIKRNNKTYERLADHIGLIPLVMISPYDRDLISEHSDTRRKFIDRIISQADSFYLGHLMAYQKVLLQRNKLLKYFAANHRFDADTINIYNEQLHQYGTAIYEKRKKFIEVFGRFLQQKYALLSGGKEQVDINYSSGLSSKTLFDLLQENIQRDRMLQHTSKGVHRDDFLFKINGKPIKKFGSQGQQKSYLIALKLAEFEFLKNKSAKTPVLLFDDIFDKLDENRVTKIVEMVNDKTFGQIFISDTHARRTENLVKNIHQSFKIFEL